LSLYNFFHCWIKQIHLSVLFKTSYGKNARVSQ